MKRTHDVRIIVGVTIQEDEKQFRLVLPHRLMQFTCEALYHDLDDFISEMEYQNIDIDLLYKEED